MGRTYQFLRILFIALIVISALLVVTNVLVAIAFDAHMTDRLQSSYDAYSSLVQVNSVLTILALLVTVTGFACLIVWTRRAYMVSERAPIVQATRKYSRGMAIAWWFVPIGNFFMPKKVISEIERSLRLATETTHYSGDWRLRPVNRRGTKWWVLFVVASVLGRAGSSGETDAQGFLTDDAVFTNAFGSALSRVVVIVSLLYGINYLRYVTDLAEKLVDTQQPSGSSSG